VFAIGQLFPEVGQIALGALILALIFAVIAGIMFALVVWSQRRK
jgi:hypothetical protein